jgi:hypothetical protein
MNVGSQEASEYLGKGASPQPRIDRVKHQFVATIGISIEN